MAHGDRKVARRLSGFGLAFVVGLQLVLLWPFRQYVTDDTYIHLQFARNLAAGAGFSFAPGDPVYGFTSPLWVMLLAAGDRLGADGLVLSPLLGLLFTVGSVIAVYAIAAIWIPNRVLRWAATLSWAVDAWLLRWALSGMETSLAVFLVAVAFALHARARRDGTSTFPAMVFFSLSALARPECLALAALAWVDAWFPFGAWFGAGGRPALADVGKREGEAGTSMRGSVDRGSLRRSVERGSTQRSVDRGSTQRSVERGSAQRSVDRGSTQRSVERGSTQRSVDGVSIRRSFGRATIRRLVEGAAPPVLLLGPWFLYALVTFGRWLPTSVASKSPGFAGSAGTVLGTLVREVTLVGATRGAELLLIGVAGTALLARHLRGRRGAWNLREGVRVYGLAVTWIAVLILGYALRETVLVSRYILLIGPPLTVLAWAGLAAIPRNRLLPVALAAGMVAVTLNLSVLYARSLPHTRAFTHGLHDSIGEIAAWLRENTPEGTTVASPDIGLLGFSSSRTVIDLSGLVTPDLIPLFEGRRIEDFISAMGFASLYQPDYLIDRADERERLPLAGPHGERLEVVMVREIGALGVARRGPYYYTLYRIDWSEVSQPPGGRGLLPVPRIP